MSRVTIRDVIDQDPFASAQDYRTLAAELLAFADEIDRHPAIAGLLGERVSE